PPARRRSNSSRVTNSYCTPSTSFVRRGRVVAEIENVHSGRTATSRSTSVPLPAPDGPESTSRKPPGMNRDGIEVAASGIGPAAPLTPAPPSLDVLHLLAQALQLFLDHHHRV